MVRKDLVDFVVHSSFFVGLVGVSMVITTSVLLSLPVKLELLAIVFLVPFALYNFNRSTDVEEDIISHPERTEFVKQYQNHLKLFAVLSYILGVAIAFYLSIKVGILTLAYTAMVMLYSISWIPISSYDRLKEILVVKNATVAAAWAMFVTFLPVAYLQSTLEASVGVIFGFIFLKVFGNTVTFDVRDIEGDRSEGIITVPVRLGVKKTKYVLTVVNWTAFLILILSVFSSILPDIAYLVSGVTIYTQMYINQIGKMDMNKIADILADGEYIIMCILVSLGVLI